MSDIKNSPGSVRSIREALKRLDGLPFVAPELREQRLAFITEVLQAALLEYEQERLVVLELVASLDGQLKAPFSINAHDGGGGVTHRRFPVDDGARTGCRKCLIDERSEAVLKKAVIFK